jgi:hypothetical protein
MIPPISVCSPVRLETELAKIDVSAIYLEKSLADKQVLTTHIDTFMRYFRLFLLNCIGHG